MLPPTPDDYRNNAQRCREAAASDPDRYLAARWREAADEYEHSAALLRALELPSKGGSGASQRQARQQQQTRAGPPAPSTMHAVK